MLRAKLLLFMALLQDEAMANLIYKRVKDRLATAVHIEDKVLKEKNDPKDCVEEWFAEPPKMFIFNTQDKSCQGLKEVTEVRWKTPGEKNLELYVIMEGTEKDEKCNADIDKDIEEILSCKEGELIKNKDKMSCKKETPGP